MIMLRNTRESGAANILLISTVALGIVCAGLAVLSVWAYVNYTDQKTNVDGRVDSAVAVAKKSQADSDETKFAAREKEPMRQFTGPEDYGQLTFNYPKTWSVYVNKDSSTGGVFEAYLNPVSVPPVSNLSTQQYALRVTIESKDYDQVISSYQALVQKGNLKSSAVKANGDNGTRLDGNFNKDIRGSAVLLKIRDKTLTVRTDADTFKPDFDALIATIKFNQ
jgi:hypothetical protein